MEFGGEKFDNLFGNMYAEFDEDNSGDLNISELVKMLEFLDEDGQLEPREMGAIIMAHYQEPSTD
jgi:Ca2+-binding EF-hand superfamily protein